MPWKYKWQGENNDWFIDQDEKQLKLWKDRKAMLERRLAGWTDPEHPLRPQEKRKVGPIEAKFIKDAIKSCDEWIKRYEADLKKRMALKKENE